MSEAHEEELAAEVAWLEALAARAAEGRPCLEGRTWGWWAAYHRDQAFDDSREARRCRRQTARRSWAQTSVRHWLAAVALKYDIDKGCINGAAVREVSGE